MQWYIFHLLTICLNKHQILLNCFLWLFVPEKFPSVLFIRNFSIRMFSIDVYLKTVAHFFQLIYTSEIIATCTVLKFCIKNIFSKCDKNCSFLQIWSHLLKKFLIENFIFCAVLRIFWILLTHFKSMDYFYTP